MIQQSLKFYSTAVNKMQYLDFIPLLLLRLYLAPIMMQAGWTKLQSFNETLDWFANPDWGLGLPLPLLMLCLVIALELFGGLALLFGLLTRLSALGLSVTMLVAIFTVHAKNGWLAIADASSWLADGTIFHSAAVLSAPDKLAKVNEVLSQQPDYEWLLSSGKLVILNNGIEFAATYFVMLLVLALNGGGRWVSLDFWLARILLKRVLKQQEAA